jgi:chromosome segregation ATPase
MESVEPSKHGGPNDWQEARRGLIRRKKKINQRNQQVRGLKGELTAQREKFEKRIEELEKAGDELSKSFTHSHSPMHRMGVPCGFCEAIFNWQRVREGKSK